MKGTVSQECVIAPTIILNRTRSSVRIRRARTRISGIAVALPVSRVLQMFVGTANNNQ